MDASDACNELNYAKQQPQLKIIIALVNKMYYGRFLDKRATYQAYTQWNRDL